MGMETVNATRWDAADGDTAIASFPVRILGLICDTPLTGSIAVRNGTTDSDDLVLNIGTMSQGEQIDFKGALFDKGCFIDDDLISGAVVVLWSKQ